jgi:hypothetical protein
MHNLIRFGECYAEDSIGVLILRGIIHPARFESDFTIAHFSMTSQLE